MKLRLSPILTALLFCGCQQNPFPGTQLVQQVPAPAPAPTNDPVPQPTTTPKPVPAYVLNVPSVMVFREKEEREYILQASVPPPGVPIVTALDLPKGASFSPDSMKLRWVPVGFGGASTAPVAAPITVRFALQSSADSVTTYVHSAVLFVQNEWPAIPASEENAVW